MIHAVEVAASSLYGGAATKGIAEFRRCDLMERQPGHATRLTVAVRLPATAHEITVGKLVQWLKGNGKSPKEQLLEGAAPRIDGI